MVNQTERYKPLAREFNTFVFKGAAWTDNKQLLDNTLMAGSNILDIEVFSGLVCRVFISGNSRPHFSVSARMLLKLLSCCLKYHKPSSLRYSLSPQHM